MSFLTDLLLKIILFECCEANRTLKFLNILFLIEKFSGKFLVRGGKNRTNDGIESPRTVVVEFPDYNTAINCYDSKDYKDAHNILDGHVIRHHQIVEGN